MATKKTATKKTVASEIIAAVKKTVAKKAAVKKTAVKRTATKKVVATETQAPAPVVQDTTLTTIVAKCDCGFGNSLFLRGEGAGLSWETGVPMENSSSDEWTWTTDKATAEIEIKVLRNDSEWALGDNITVAAGSKSVIEPTF